MFCLYFVCVLPDGVNNNNNNNNNDDDDDVDGDNKNKNNYDINNSYMC